MAGDAAASPAIVDGSEFTVTTTAQEPGTTAPADTVVPRARWRMPWPSFVIGLIALLGVGILLYPAAASWFMQYQLSQRIDAYSAGMQELAENARATELERAHAYNATLVGAAEVAAGERIPVFDDRELDLATYNALVASDARGLMARVKIPAIDVDLPVYHGTSDEVLTRGIGHIPGTALPVGGDSTHAVLTGHRGLASAELFTNLDRVHVGDTFTIEAFGEVLTYEVTETRVVQPDETETLYPQRDRDLVTLVTCTPLGINSHRILVTGERITPTPPEEVAAMGQRPEVPGFPWWTVLAGGVLLVVVAYVWLSGRPRREGASYTREGAPSSREGASYTREGAPSSREGAT